MPSLKTYDIFISHAWRYGDDYGKIVEFLDQSPYFNYRNYSAPKDKPLFPENMRFPDSYTREKIVNKIKPVNIVLIISGMYYYYHEWIQEELNIAKSFNKPVIAIKPWGAKKTPNEIDSQVIATVGWNTDSIIQAIRNHSL